MSVDLFNFDILPTPKDIKKLRLWAQENFRRIQSAFANIPSFDQIVMPSGGIILWSGAVANIPTGWALCDGSDGTPDLRDRFIVGAGSTYAVADTGGASSVTLDTAKIPAHTHVFTGDATGSGGGHTHGYSDSGSSSIDVTDDGTSQVSVADDTTGTPTTDSSGAHTHTVTGTNASTGGGAAHENRPPYYALAYIMRL